MSEATPDFSVVIATRSRADSIGRTLESMTRMDTAGVSWELVVIENGSDDHTCEVLDSYLHRLPLRWFTVLERGQNRARNRALASLRGRTTILSDDDVIVAPDWLQQWKRGVDRWPRDSVFAGCIAPRFPAGTAEWIRSEHFPFRAQCFAELRPAQPEGPFSRAFGPNFAVRTALLQSQPFREDFGPAAGSYAVGGETELTDRLAALGHRIVYLPQARVEHVLLAHNLTEEKLLLRGFNGGRGDECRRAMRRHWGRPMLYWRQYAAVPAKVVFYALLTAVAAAASPHRRFRLQYKYQSARGRQYQLRQMLRQAPPPPVVHRSAKPFAAP